MVINIYTIQQDVENANWKLVSTEYKNLKTPLDYICPKGHKVTDTYESWRKNHYCPECQKIESKGVVRNQIPEKQPNVYRILALDAATEITGYAIYDDKRLVAYGTFTVVHNDNPTCRINQVKKWLKTICDKCQPDAVGVEGIQYQKNVKMFQTLANLQGVILDFLYENRESYEYKVANSSAWRSYLGINSGDERESAKKRAQSYVKTIFNLAATQDEADAICIGKYFCFQFNGKKKLTWGEDIL